MLQVYLDDDTTLLDALPLENIEAGEDSDTLSLHVWQDKGNDAGQDLPNVLLVLRTEDPVRPGIYIATGVPPQDELWGRGRIVGFDNAGDTTWSVPDSDWYPLGASAGIPVATIPANCAVYLEVLMHPPRTADEIDYNWALRGLAKEYSMPVATGVTAAQRGILHGIGETSRSGVVSGMQVSASGSPDEFVNVAAGFALYRGRLQGYVATPIELDQDDVAAATLAATESYWAAITVNASGPHATKGIKGTAPTKPTPPAGEPFLKYAKVDYQVGGTSVIEAADLDGTLLYDRYYAEDDGSGDLLVHPGQAQGTTTQRFAFGTQLVPIDDDSTAYVWQLASGLFTATASDVAPVGSLEWWWKVTKASGAITAIVDRRTYAGQTVAIHLAGDLPGSVGSIAQQYAGHERLVLEDAIWSVSDNGGGSSGLTRLDLEINGTTIFTSFATDDQRPTFDFDASAGELVVRGKVHEVTEILGGDLLDLVSVTHPTGGTPTSARVCLICRVP